MRRSSHTTGMITAGLNELSTISAAWFPGGHQIFVVYIAQHAGHSEPNALADLDVGDVTTTHPDFDCPLGDSEILRNLPLSHEPVFKRDRFTCRRLRGATIGNMAPRHLAVAASAEFNSAEHTLNRTATDQSARTSGRRKRFRCKSSTTSKQRRGRATAVASHLSQSYSPPNSTRSKTKS